MLKIGVIFGGRSGEHEVSLMSAQSVLMALNTQKYEITQIGISLDGKWWSGENVLETFLDGSYSKKLYQVCLLPDPTRPTLFRLYEKENGQVELVKWVDCDVFFPILHGTFGEDGTIQGLFELADIAYVGGGVLGSALGMDKAVFKTVMQAHQVPVVEMITVLRSEIEAEPDRVIQFAEDLADYPLFVKPANLGSSVGITKCMNRSDLMEGLLEACLYDRKVVIERGLDAREIEISVLGNDAPMVSLPGEILPSREFYSYEAKYIDNQSRLLIPAPISPEMSQKVQDLALRAYKAIECFGMARIDFLLEKNPPQGSDGLFLSEVNTIPGFTQISMYPKLWEASGLSYDHLLDKLIELAIEHKKDRDRIERQYKSGSKQ